MCIGLKYTGAALVARAASQTLQSNNPFELLFLFMQQEIKHQKTQTLQLYKTNVKEIEKY